MARISFTLTGMQRMLVNNWNSANAQIAMSTYKMSTGHNINSAADDPGTFVQLSGLQNQLATVNTVVANVAAASAMMTDTQSAATGIQNQLKIIQTELKKDENHTLTADQRAASQATIDAALKAIDNLAGSSIDGKATLSGAGDYNYSGLNSNQVSSVSVLSGSPATGRTISGKVVTAATQASQTYSGNAANEVTANASFTLSGDLGSASVTVTTGETLSDAAAAINNVSHKTGVTASVDGAAHTLTLTSVDYGTSATATVAVTSGSFAVTGNASGTNASAIINGKTITANSPNVSGNKFTVSDNGFAFQVEFKAGFTGSFDTMTLQGSALTFSLSSSLNASSTVALSGMYTSELGGLSGKMSDLASGGSLSGLSTNTSQALRVVGEALGQTTAEQGKVTGFLNATVTASSGLYSAMQTTLSDFIDQIDTVDDAAQEANISNYQALASNSLSGLAILAQQQMSTVNVLQSLAGLSPSSAFF